MLTILSLLLHGLHGVAASATARKSFPHVLLKCLSRRQNMGNNPDNECLGEIRDIIDTELTNLMAEIDETQEQIKAMEEERKLFRQVQKFIDNL
jgi:hypothetical protein